MSTDAFCPRCGKKISARKTVTVDMETGKPVRNLLYAYIALLVAAGLGFLVGWLVVGNFLSAPSSGPFLGFLISLSLVAGGWGLVLSFGDWLACVPVPCFVF